jgi:hypothetical protein
MPLHSIIKIASFDPAAIKCLTAAYEDACAELHIVVPKHALQEIVAKKIIEHAQRGERDPILLREAVVNELRELAASGA